MSRPRASATVLYRQCLLAGFIGVLTLTLGVGCGKGPPPIKGKLPVFPVKGRLLMDGQPMAAATIIFNPVRKYPKGAALQRPRAVVDADGNFQVSTYDNDDGAPAGDYKVTLSWKGPLEGVNSEQKDELPEKVPQMFQEARRSLLRVQIKEGENTLPTWDLAQFESHASNTP